MKIVKLRLTLDVEFDPADLTTAQLMENTHRAVRIGMAEGLFTGYTEATVENWSADVEER